MGRIIYCEVQGKAALGFDTGLDAKAFAQTKTAQIITQPGYIVKPDSSIEVWKLEGVIEREGTMVLWGDAFEGERLDVLITDNTRQDEALDALRYWIQARIFLELKGIEHLPAPYPAGAIFASQDTKHIQKGTLLFPPDSLVNRSIEAEGSEAWLMAAERWVHPYLTGAEADTFVAGTMLYQVFSGSVPFPNPDINVLRQDIREGVFFPLRLASPGLDSKLVALISSAIASFTQNQQKKTSTTLDLRQLRDFLGPPGSAKARAYVHALSAEEQEKLKLEQERFKKKNALTVKTRRFVIRNTTIIAVLLASLLGVGLIVRSVITERSNGPTTKNMTPIEVVETYYKAIGVLDHQQMEACVIGKAGKADIEMVINYFVISKVRQAYEMSSPGIIPAQEWIDAGAMPTEATVFGVSDLQVEAQDQDETDGEVSFTASYVMWVPETDASADVGSEPAGVPTEAANLPRSIPMTDEIRLVLHKEAWRITEIKRENLIQ